MPSSSRYLLLLALLPMLAASLALHYNATVPLCEYNTIGFVPGLPNYTFSVVNKKFTASYKPTDFNVSGWQYSRFPSHPFFNWIGLNTFRNAFSAMGCQVVNQNTVASICNISHSQIGQVYNSSIGPDIAFRCTVPANHFVMSLVFQPKINGWNTTANSQWSIFRGLYPYTNASDANNTIYAEGTRIAKKINSTNLNTLDINQNLNVNPSLTDSTLASEFNSHIHTHFALNIVPSAPHALVDEGYLKILHPGSHFIVGAIYNGTVSVKQMCDNQPVSSAASADCGLKL
jgi:hypothetical protein